MEWRKLRMCKCLPDQHRIVRCARSNVVTHERRQGAILTIVSHKAQNCSLPWQAGRVNEKKRKKNAWRHSIYLNSNTFLLTPFHKYHVYLHIKQTPVKKKSAEWLPITAFHHDFFLLLFFTAIYILVRLRHIYSSSPMPVNAIETAYPSRLPRTQ